MVDPKEMPDVFPPIGSKRYYSRLYTEYDRLKEYLRNKLPVTMYPDLLATIVIASVENNVWAEGGLKSFIERVEGIKENEVWTIPTSTTEHSEASRKQRKRQKIGSTHQTCLGLKKKRTRI